MAAGFWPYSGAISTVRELEKGGEVFDWLRAVLGGKDVKSSPC